MAQITVKEDVTEIRVIEKGGVTVELSHEEAQNLALLLRGGVGSSTLTTLGLYSLMQQFGDEGFGEEPRGNYRKWKSTAQRTEL